MSDILSVVCVKSDARMLLSSQSLQILLEDEGDISDWGAKECTQSLNLSATFSLCKNKAPLHDPCDLRDYNTEAASEWNKQCRISPPEAWTLART